MSVLTREQLEEKCRWLDGNAAYQLVLEQYAALCAQLQACREEREACGQAVEALMDQDSANCNTIKESLRREPEVK